MSAEIRSRIAPTPSGWLHLGNAYNFLLTEAITRSRGGRLRLRIDDLDAPRVRKEYIEDVFETLHWLNIFPDDGPLNPDAHSTSFRQSARLQEYEALLRNLAEERRVFACTCTRSELARRSKDGQYDGACRQKGIPLDEPGAAWRFRTEDGERAVWEDGISGRQAIRLDVALRDFIVRRADALPAYHIASLSDDLRYGINVIVRGADLVQSTAAQLAIARALGLRPFQECRFYHHPLILDEGGGKLSKSAGADSLRGLRERGCTGTEIRRKAAQWYGAFWS